MVEVSEQDLLRMVLVHVRLIRGLSQAEMAERLGIDASLVSRYESGNRALPAGLPEAWAAAAGVPFSLVEQMLAVSAAVRQASAEEPAQELTALARVQAHELGRRLAETGRALAEQILRELPARVGEWAHRAPAPSRADLAVGDELWTALEGSTATGRLLVEATQEYRHWGLCVRVCAESRAAAAAGNGSRALDLADLARRIADEVRGEPAWRSRLRGYVWAHIAGARLAAGDPSGARRALAVAKPLWQESGEDYDLLLEPPRMLLGVEAAHGEPEIA